MFKCSLRVEHVGSNIFANVSKCWHKFDFNCHVVPHTALFVNGIFHDQISVFNAHFNLKGDNPYQWYLIQPFFECDCFWIMENTSSFANY